MVYLVGMTETPLPWLSTTTTLVHYPTHSWLKKPGTYHMLGPVLDTGDEEMGKTVSVL